MSVVCVCRVVRVCVYEQMLQLYPDERHSKKTAVAMESRFVADGLAGWMDP